LHLVPSRSILLHLVQQLECAHACSFNVDCVCQHPQPTRGVPLEPVLSCVPNVFLMCSNVPEGCLGACSSSVCSASAACCAACCPPPCAACCPPSRCNLALLPWSQDLLTGRAAHSGGARLGAGSGCKCSLFLGLRHPSSRALGGAQSHGAPFRWWLCVLCCCLLLHGHVPVLAWQFRV